jgi:PEP-CTERM motif
MLLFGGLTQAQAYTTTLDLSNNNNFNNPPFATVTIDELLSGDIQFTIDLVGADTSGQNIELFGFNIFGDTSLTAENIILPANWSAAIEPSPNTMAVFGAFDIAVKMTGSQGFDPLTFTISTTGDSIATYATSVSTGGQPNAGSLFAAKISSTGPGAFIGGGSPVPLPATVWLFGSGILGLFVYARREILA